VHLLALLAVAAAQPTSIVAFPLDPIGAAPDDAPALEAGGWAARVVTPPEENDRYHSERAIHFEKIGARVGLVGRGPGLSMPFSGLSDAAGPLPGSLVGEQELWGTCARPRPEGLLFLPADSSVWVLDVRALEATPTCGWNALGRQVTDGVTTRAAAGVIYHYTRRPACAWQEKVYEGGYAEEEAVEAHPSVMAHTLFSVIRVEGDEVTIEEHRDVGVPEAYRADWEALAPGAGARAGGRDG